MDWATTHHVKAEKDGARRVFRNQKLWPEWITTGQLKWWKGRTWRVFVRNVWMYIKVASLHMRNVMNKLPNYKGTVYRGSSIKNSATGKAQHRWHSAIYKSAFLSTRHYLVLPRTFGFKLAFTKAFCSSIQNWVKVSRSSDHATMFKPDESWNTR